MIAYLLKNWKLFLDIIVVIGAIIALSIIDPFGIFSKRELRGTANLVSSVKDIGELVTAEYYGEVISSLNETYIFDLSPDTISVNFEECFIGIKEICDSYKKKNANNIISTSEYKTLKKQYSNIYKYLITFVGVNLINDKEDKFFNVKKDNLHNRADNRVVNFLTSELNKIDKKKRLDESEKNELLREYIYNIPDFFEEAENYYYSLRQDHADKKSKDIIFIGRGWVKAGFKFDMLDKRNFHYNKDRKTITFYGLSPVILDKDINPWFIPEKRIKGFEVISYYKGASFEDAKIVKLKCKQKLLKQAETAGILNQAKDNGEVALRNFFSLLLNEPDLKVEFEDIPYQKTINLIAADTLITVQEALEIGEIIENYKDEISKSVSPRKEKQVHELMIFYNKLTALPFINEKYSFNLFALEAAKILNDKYYVSYSDYLNFKDNVRGTLQLKNIPEEDPVINTNFLDKQIIKSEYPDFVHQFNEIARCLQEQIEQAVSDTALTIEIRGKRLKKLIAEIDTSFDFIDIDTTSKITDGDTVYVLNRTNKSLTYSFSDLVYPDFEVSKRYSDTLKFKDIDQIDPFLTKMIDKTDYYTMHTGLDTQRKKELFEVIKPYEQKRIEKQVKLRPANRVISWINKQFNP